VSPREEVVVLGRNAHPKGWLNFDDVVYCRDIKRLNEFIEQYLSERGLVDEERRRTYWALFYRWKEAHGLGGK
jgi:hypothetical protein